VEAAGTSAGVRKLRQNCAKEAPISLFSHFLRLLESVSYVESMAIFGSTPAASTNNLFIFNNLQTKSARKAKNIATGKLFRIK
jgi:hypothetical protein